mgnify:CR=1 FL=1
MKSLLEMASVEAASALAVLARELQRLPPRAAPPDPALVHRYDELRRRLTDAMRQEAADIDLRALAEQHAVGVDDEDLTVGVDGAVDDAALVADDAVQRRGRTVGLVEVDGVLRADRKTLPVDDGLLRRLIDVCDRAGLRDAGGARDHRTAGRALRGGRMRQRHHRANRGGRQQGHPERSDRKRRRRALHI